MKISLTPKQLAIVRLIQDSRASFGYAPTMQEMAENLSVSKVTVFERVEALVRKGVLSRERNISRSLRICDGITIDGFERVYTESQVRAAIEAENSIAFSDGEFADKIIARMNGVPETSHPVPAGGAA